MRETSIIVDDVSKNHTINNEGDKDTQSITFKDGITIALKCCYTLMSFETSILTEHEIQTLPTYDIVMEGWDPQMYYDGINDDLSIMSGKSVPDSGEDTFSVDNQTLLEDIPDNKFIELPDKMKEYIAYDPTSNTNLSSYHSGEQSFISYFINVNIDAVFEKPNTADSYDKDSNDKTTKFYEIKSYYENINYWHEDNHDIWYDLVSSGEPTDDIKNHLDTKGSKEELTKDINSQTDK